MKFPGTPATRWKDGQTDEERAEWLLDLVDDGDGRALVAVPAVGTESSELDALEDDLRRAHDLARASGREIVVRLLHSQDLGGPRDGASRILICLMDRAVDDGPAEA